MGSVCREILVLLFTAILSQGLTLHDDGELDAANFELDNLDHVDYAEDEDGFRFGGDEGDTLEALQPSDEQAYDVLDSLSMAAAEEGRADDSQPARPTRRRRGRGSRRRRKASRPTKEPTKAPTEAPPPDTTAPPTKPPLEGRVARLEMHMKKMHRMWPHMHRELKKIPHMQKQITFLGEWIKKLIGATPAPTPGPVPSPATRRRRRSQTPTRPPTRPPRPQRRRRTPLTGPPLTACKGKQFWATCSFPMGNGNFTGKCLSSRGKLLCMKVPPHLEACNGNGKKPAEKCMYPHGNGTRHGVCAPTFPAGMLCRYPRTTEKACFNKTINGTCSYLSRGSTMDGKCVVHMRAGKPTTLPYCRATPPQVKACANKTAKDNCTYAAGKRNITGVCHSFRAGGLYCRQDPSNHPHVKACSGKEAGDQCIDPSGKQHHAKCIPLKMWGKTVLTCRRMPSMVAACKDKEVAANCTHSHRGKEIGGKCQEIKLWNVTMLICRTPPRETPAIKACKGLTMLDGCNVTYAPGKRMTGRCVPMRHKTLQCMRIPGHVPIQSFHGRFQA